MRPVHHVDHHYLEAVLRAANFGPIFLGQIAASYCSIYSILRVNGHLYIPFKITNLINQAFDKSFALVKIDSRANTAEAVDAKGHLARNGMLE